MTGNRYLDCASAPSPRSAAALVEVEIRRVLLLVLQRSVLRPARPCRRQDRSGCLSSPLPSKSDQEMAESGRTDSQSAEAAPSLLLTAASCGCRYQSDRGGVTSNMPLLCVCAPAQDVAEWDAAAERTGRAWHPRRGGSEPASRAAEPVRIPDSWVYVSKTLFGFLEFQE